MCCLWLMVHYFESSSGQVGCSEIQLNSFKHKMIWYDKCIILNVGQQLYTPVMCKQVFPVFYLFTCVCFLDTVLLSYFSFNYSVISCLCSNQYYHYVRIIVCIEWSLSSFPKLRQSVKLNKVKSILSVIIFVPSNIV